MSLPNALGRALLRPPGALPRVWLDKRFYKMSVQSIKKGQIVQLKDKAWRVLNRDHSMAGRGGAVVKMDLQDIISGAKIGERFKSGDTLEILNLNHEDYQFLYVEDGVAHMMSMESYEELELPVSACEGGDEALALLEDGMTLNVSFLTTLEEGRRAVTFRLPQNHTFTVGSVMERGGQAAKGTVFKTATLTNGVKLQVPEFVHAGDRIVVDIENMKYVKRDL